MHHFVKRLLIVGLGSIGRRYFRLIRKMYPDMEVILARSGVGPPLPEESIAKKVVFSIEEALEYNIDAAIISSPATFHVEQSIKLLKKGVHLLIEKPVSNNTKDIDRLVRLASKSNVKILIGYVLRHDPAAIEFKRRIQSEKIGDLLHVSIECGSYLPDWRPGQDYRKTVSALSNLGGGVLLELSHELDYLRWFFGDPLSVFSILSNSKTLEINVEDQASMLFTIGDSITAVLQMDFNRKHPIRLCKLQTTKGELTWNSVKKKIVWNQSNEDIVEVFFDFDHDYLYIKQLRHFIDCIENNVQPVATLDDGVAVMRMINSIKKSNFEQKMVPL